MSASFRKIDYSLRPAKYAERKMMVEIFRRLAPFQAVEEYFYIGFGSVWFSDFILFHRALGIRDMISIEQSEGASERFMANRPFNIEVIFDKASVALPSFEWNKRGIVWLDYDEPLATSMLHDVQTVSRRATSGSVLAISLQCMKAQALHDAQQEGNKVSALSGIERFRQMFGREKVPQHAADDDLAGWPYGKLSREMLIAEIEEALLTRNMNLEDKVRFMPLCEIEYQDDAKMTTLVGIFVAESAQGVYESCAFDRLDFLGNGIKVKIEMPKLTIRELRYLEQQLPRVQGQELRLGAIPPSDAQKFCSMYRYFPNFAVMES